MDDSFKILSEHLGGELERILNRSDPNRVERMGFMLLLFPDMSDDPDYSGGGGYGVITNYQNDSHLISILTGLVEQIKRERKGVH